MPPITIPLRHILGEDDPSRQYQRNFDISYYIIPHGRLLTELTQEKHVPEVIAPNEQDNPQTEDVKVPPDQEITEETHEQNVQDKKIINQSTKGPSGNNTELSVWSKDQHIELVNIIEPKKVSKALKHPGWVDAMQEELNQFYKNKAWTLVPLPYGKTAIGSKWVFRNEKDEHVARMEAIRIFLAFATYMNFIVFLMDVKSAFLNGKLKEEIYVKQPPCFESSEFPDYVCKLDKALYGMK
ncbi:retrovirus-related pol polyprotein from transposon TNT 1-94 [Tanacetum coccineum]